MLPFGRFLPKLGGAASAAFSLPAAQARQGISPYITANRWSFTILSLMTRQSIADSLCFRAGRIRADRDNKGRKDRTATGADPNLAPFTLSQFHLSTRRRLALSQ